MEQARKVSYRWSLQVERQRYEKDVSLWMQGVSLWRFLWSKTRPPSWESCVEAIWWIISSRLERANLM